MPGPKSHPVLREFNGGVLLAPVVGKTKIDHYTGKWARRQANRHADPIREGGGKQFGGKKH